MKFLVHFIKRVDEPHPPKSLLICDYLLAFQLQTPSTFFTEQDYLREAQPERWLGKQGYLVLLQERLSDDSFSSVCFLRREQEQAAKVLNP